MAENWAERVHPPARPIHLMHIEGQRPPAKLRILSGFRHAAALGKYHASAGHQRRTLRSARPRPRMLCGNFVQNILAPKGTGHPGSLKFNLGT